MNCTECGQGSNCTIHDSGIHCTEEDGDFSYIPDFLGRKRIIFESSESHDDLDQAIEEEIDAIWS